MKSRLDILAPTFLFTRSQCVVIHRIVPYRRYSGLGVQKFRLLEKTPECESARRRIQWYRCASTNAAANSTISRGVRVSPATPPAKRKDIKPPAKQEAAPRPTSIPPSKRVSLPTTLPARSFPKSLVAATAAPTASTDVSSEFTSKLNPPDFMHPPELTVPSREPGQAWVKYALRAGRAYLTFYKSGIKNIWTASKIAKKLRNKDSSVSALTRAEWQTVLRSRRDVLRLPAFGLLVLVFGEWLPLFVIFVTPLIPEVCRIPIQRRRVLEKRERRREERARRVRLSGAADISLLELTARIIRELDVSSLEKPRLLTISARLDCHAQLWDILNVTPPSALLRRNVTSKVMYLKKDDDLIMKEGGWKTLDAREVERACVERGMDVLRKEEKELRTSLEDWFTGR